MRRLVTTLLTMTPKQLWHIHSSSCRGGEPTEQQSGSWDIKSVWWCTRNATAASTQCWGALTPSKLLQSCCGLGQQPCRWAALQPWQSAINDLTLNMCLLVQLRIGCKVELIKNNQFREHSWTGKPQHHWSIKQLLHIDTCYLLLLPLDQRLLPISTTLLPVRASLLPYYYTLVHYYYLVIACCYCIITSW